MKRCSLVVLVVCVSGCVEPMPPPPPPPVEPVVFDHWSPTNSQDAGTAMPGPVAVGRVARRLTTRQLDASFRALLGDGWSLNAVAPGYLEVPGLPAPVPVDIPFKFDALGFLGSGLGGADYLTEFRENTDVTPSFAKLMDNWASYQCVVAVLHDYTVPADAGHFFVPQLPDSALQPDGGSAPARRAAFLEAVRLGRLHFHSVYTLPTNAEAELGSIVDTALEVSLRRRAELTMDTDGGSHPTYSPAQSDLAALGAACTLLLTDPEFVTY